MQPPDQRPQGRPRNPAIKELNKSLVLPKAVLGQLDWTTGILRINTTHEKWKAWKAAPAAHKSLFSVLWHEGQHAIQIAACTKLYKTSLYLYGIVRHIDELYPDAADLPDDLANSSLDPQLLKALQATVWDLSYKKDDLTILEIVEALTHLTEQRLSKNFDTDSYLAYIPKALVGPLYTKAYVRFHELSGQHPKSLAFFTPVCHIALCSDTPQTSFCALASALKTGRLTTKSELSDFINICREDDPDFLSWPWDWRRGHGDALVHPLFERLQSTLLTAAKTGAHFIKYIWQLHTEFDLWMSSIEQPTILNPVNDPAAPGYREWQALVWHWEGTPDQEEKGRRLRKLVKAATIARRYMAHFGNPPPKVTRVFVARS